MKVFVISLKGASARQAQAQAQLQAAGIEFSFFEGVNGRGGFERFFEAYDERQYLINTGWVAGSGELGCYASHLALWKKCVDLEEPLLIMEDDFRLLPNFADAVTESEKLIGRYGFIRLHFEDRSSRRPVHESGVEVDVRVEIAGDEVIVREGMLLEFAGDIEQRYDAVAPRSPRNKPSKHLLVEVAAIAIIDSGLGVGGDTVEGEDERPSTIDRFEELGHAQPA